MKADGINPEELLGNSLLLHHVLVKRQPRPAKYKFTDVNGETKTRPVRAVHRSQLLRRWQKVNLSTIS